MKMKPVGKRKATGFLAELLSNTDEKEFARTRKRMMVAAKIADAMRKEGYSQKDFAAKMGKSETVISEWLSGDRNFRIDTLSEIEDVLGIRLIDTSSMVVFNVGDGYTTSMTCQITSLHTSMTYQSDVRQINEKIA